VQAHAHLGAIAQVAVPVVVAGGLAVGLFVWIRRQGGAARWGRALRTGATDVRRGLLTRRTWPGIVVSSALVLAGHLATFLVAARAAGASAPVTRLVPLMMLALFAMALPLNIGGWGPREGVTAWAFGAAGLGATQGLTIAVVYGLFAFVASLPGVVVLVGQWIIRLRAARAPAVPVEQVPVEQVSAERVPVERMPVERERVLVLSSS
jgi:hypothetical protein